MAGLYVRCGSFEGSDKSVSALQEMLEGLSDPPPGALDAIKPVFDDCYASVPEATAGALLPCLRVYRAALVARLGHEDVEKADHDARLAGVVGLRKGDGWCLLCIDETIIACETSITEHQPVIFRYY